MKTIFTLIIFCLSFCLSAQFSQYSMLDYSFGDDGKVSADVSQTKFNGVTRTHSVLLQKDGKIITAGERQTGITINIFLARFLTDGKIDTSFGKHGFIYFGNSNRDLLFQAQLQSDEKIVAVILSGGKKYLIRFASSGFDSSFGINGFVQIAHRGYDLCIDNNDNIIVGETYLDKGLMTCAVQRFKKNGAPDYNFGTNNFSSIAVYHYDGYIDMTCRIKLDSNKNIVLGGTSYVNSNAYFIIIRFKPDGTIDSSFNKTGLAVLHKHRYESKLTAIAIQSDNKIIAAGYADMGFSPNDNFIITRLNSNGTIDSSFGVNGSASNDFNYNPNAYPKKQDILTALLIQRDNKIIAVGYSKKYLFGDAEFALCRFTINGLLDTSFGFRGEVKTKFGDNEPAVANDAVLQPDGKIVVAGYHEMPNGHGDGGEIAITRYVEEKVNQTKAITNDLVKSNNCSITIYPNPVHNILYITNLDATELHNIQITNIYGSIVSSTQINKTTSYNFNVENLSCGVYYITIISNQKFNFKEIYKRITLGTQKIYELYSIS